jgi:hypothetical protein
MNELSFLFSHLNTLKPYEIVVFVIGVLFGGSGLTYLFYSLITDSIKIYKNEDEKVPCKGDGFLWK